MTAEAPAHEQAARLLQIAQRCADTAIAEAQETAARLVAEARAHAEALERAGREQLDLARAEVARLQGAEAEVRAGVARLRDQLAGALEVPAATQPEPSLYERLGGTAGIGAAVEAFYERVVADPQLAPYFAGTDMATLRRHQTALLSQVTGGPAHYAGRDLSRAHARLGITAGDFDRVVEHLAGTLTDLGVAPADVEAVGAALTAHRGDIVQDRAQDPAQDGTSPVGVD
ncbi:globin domain-containing protein [Kineococcus sp. SYSU DK003]|uniref:globin domain-containing protein n=1 Tax=Kineococcus sp. SYSU DK003 TaxID=3383124 RepID=UPI003D7E1445